MIVSVPAASWELFVYLQRNIPAIVQILKIFCLYIYHDIASVLEKCTPHTHTHTCFRLLETEGYNTMSDSPSVCVCVRATHPLSHMLLESCQYIPQQTFVDVR